MGRRAHRDHRPTRRRVLGLAAASFATLIVGGCGSEQAPAVPAAQGPSTPSSPALGEHSALPATVTTMPTATNVPPPPSPSATPTPEPGRLLARPSSNVLTAHAQGGRQPLGITTERDALLYVPSSYTPERPIPVVLSLHGAGGDAEGGLALLQPLADAATLLLIAPAARRQTWDTIYGAYGPDVAVIDRALTEVFNRYAVDTSRLAIGGFSDGASYALSLGLINGDLFTHIMAFSPGFIAPESRHGQPRFFITHGTHDDVLPIDACSRRIVPPLQQAGYDVEYREFDGPHTVPPEMAQAAVRWFTDGQE